MEKIMRILIRGAGDLATGIACRLFRCGFQIIMTDLEVPTTVRRMAAFSRAIYEGKTEVEGITAVRAENLQEAQRILSEGQIAVPADPEVRCRKEYAPDVVVDAILAKRNIGTTIEDASLVIGVGPGFFVRADCHYVVETQRGHDLGRVIEEGSAVPNTGVPGEVGGYTTERLIRASGAGIFEPKAHIGEFVEKGAVVAYCGCKPVYAQMSGIIRGMLQAGVAVTEGMKCGDIDARCEKQHCCTVSDKARAVGGGVFGSNSEMPELQRAKE